MHEADLRWSPHWVIEPGDGSTVVLSGGADRRVAIDGLDPADSDLVAAWQSAGWSPGVGDRAQALTDRLVELGVLVPAVPGTGVELLGDPAVTTALASLLPFAAEPPSDLAVAVSVAVRTTADWPSVPPGRPHLGLDLALHHTIVLGPLVVPGASACLQCLDERTAYRWPRPVVPPEPAALHSLAVAAALLAVQVELVATGTSPLVNATIAWDLQRGVTDRQRVYKMVGCERCDVAAPVGRVNLGWEA